MALRSILFIIIGAIYLINPHLISKWIWSKTKTPSEATLKRFILIMRIVGGILIAVGILLAVTQK